MVAVPARVLAGPPVKYGKGKAAITRFGSWNMQLTQFSTPTVLPSWTYLWLSFEGFRDAWSDHKQVENTMNAFAAKMREVGITAGQYTPGLRITLATHEIEAQIDTIIHRFVSHPSRAPPKLLLVILPKADTAIYNRIKFACDVKEGLLNVCVIGSKFAKDSNDQYFANVALKINLKLGGRNQLLDNPKLGVISEGKTMVVGIDVTHPSPGSSSKAPSIAAIVASIDQRLGQWPADLRIQTAKQEMVSGLESMLESRLRLWQKNNQGQLPEKIIIYRDGVSEGQYNLVLDQELPLLKKCCQRVYPATATKKGLPHMTIIVVGKRHHTRFYPTTEADADRSTNPPNGTVVDRGVTEARNWDFFLQAHTAIQGTARPAHYFVIWDEIFCQRRVQIPFQNAHDALEDLTHNMCYLYGRATKAVSICPPAYYADLVCERARCYMSRLFDATPESTPGQSVISGDGGAGNPPDPDDLRIHQNVKDAMFYI
jgi:eukaryotic translation initiation factor 2C